MYLVHLFFEDTIPLCYEASRLKSRPFDTKNNA